MIELGQTSKPPSDVSINKVAPGEMNQTDANVTPTKNPAL